ncbi:MAG: NUDIX hydrolase [Clostridiaceae bacterium]
MAYKNIVGKDYNYIRVSVLGVAEINDKILVEENFDKIKNQYFYRPLGGGVDFWEDTKEALIREFKEELNADIKVLDYICTIENRFKFEDVCRHEILIIYKIQLTDEFYIKDEFIINENGIEFKAKWIDKNLFLNGELILFPKDLEKIL